MQCFRRTSSIPFFSTSGHPPGSRKPESAFSAEHYRSAVENRLHSNIAHHSKESLQNPRTFTWIKCSIPTEILLKLPQRNRMKKINLNKIETRKRIDNKVAFNNLVDMIYVPVRLF